MGYTKTFTDGVLVVTNEDDQSTLTLDINPFTNEPWADEAEALTEQDWGKFGFVPKPKIHVSKAVFTLLFSLKEMVYLDTLRDSDRTVKVAFDRLEGQLDYIDMELPFIKELLKYLFGKMVDDTEYPLTQEEADVRIAEILTGKVKK